MSTPIPEPEAPKPEAPEEYEEIEAYPEEDEDLYEDEDEDEYVDEDEEVEEASKMKYVKGQDYESFRTRKED